ncbi:hypothetical protein TTHERM_00859200 (macronuclear) [Tetrahymena thermophila SB210]|uniref:Uncharacterized protein n=1 Tax=Tetrahymena thermophila (strain SB210) TaxID=312017 RepID=Q23YU0_TETTS|nr:hypothetical protein TTHERM_00859200 [Tetrahymena thermophila SB210]EAS01715.2 hypothetical protein TTHERM_00859200 [Tetrahymena thermophila SB210]|eukprot:XP_001021960.2 hypothetical protein TTHERM_00859200 [Tetrahymena thermophila SB210]
MEFLSEQAQMQTPQRNRYQQQEPLSIQNGQFNPNSSVATNEFDSPKNEQLTSNSKRMMLLEFSPKQEPCNRYKNVVFSCEDEDSSKKQDFFDYQQTACKSVQKKQTQLQNNSSSNRKIEYEEDEYNLTPISSSKKGKAIERPDEDEIQQLNELDQQMNDMNIHTTCKKQRGNSYSGFSQNFESQHQIRNMNQMQELESLHYQTDHNNELIYMTQNPQCYQNGYQHKDIPINQCIQQEKALDYQKAFDSIIDFVNSFNCKYQQISSKLSPSCVIEIKDQQTLPKQRMIDLMFQSINRIEIIQESLSMKETNHRQISIQHNALFHLFVPNAFAQYQMFWRVSLTVPNPTITYLSIYY